MVCPYCQSNTKKHGRDQLGVQRFKCLSPACRRTSAERPPRLFGSLRVAEDKALAALGMLTDGMSVRGVERCTGLHRDTILRVQAHAGRMVYLYMDRVVRGLEIQQIQCDEIWSYVGKHDRRLTREERLNQELGSVFIFLGLDPVSKFVPSFEIGKRTTDTAWAFMHDLRRRVVGRPTIITDGYTGYLDAVPAAFGRHVDFAQLVKEFR
ncbi:MAG: IS1/IS1595 family N-terminal zinc-binding domain-containing protein, partial [Gemmatimonadales bacterium]